MRKDLFFVFVSIAASENVLPSWLPMAGRGFLEGFLSAGSYDVDSCLAAPLGPVSDIKDDMKEINVRLKDHNLTEIEEGVETLCNTMKELKASMQKCRAAEADIRAIEKVIKHIEKPIDSDLAVDNTGIIGQDFEFMARFFTEKKYQDFGYYLGQMLHRLIIGPESTVALGFGSKCKGSGDPPGPFPVCYMGAAGALGLKETVQLKVASYTGGKGTLDLTGSGITSITCTDKPFTKSGQQVAPNISDCLPSLVQVKKVLYCSDSDTLVVTVKDKKVPLPVSATLKKVACPSTVMI